MKTATQNKTALLASLAIGLASLIPAQSHAAVLTTTSTGNLEVYWNNSLQAANGNVLLRRPNSGEQSAIAAFNLGALGWNNAWTVNSATLTLTVQNDSLSGNRTLVLNAKGVAPSNSSWVAGTSTFNYQLPSSTTQWTNASGTSVGDFSIAAGTWASLGSSTTSSPSAARTVGSTLAVSLNASTVQSWLNNPALFNGMSLLANNTSDGSNIAFYGSAAAANQRPELSITYTIPEPSSALLLLSAGFLVLCLRKRGLSVHGR